MKKILFFICVCINTLFILAVPKNKKELAPPSSHSDIVFTEEMAEQSIASGRPMIFDNLQDGFKRVAYVSREKPKEETRPATSSILFASLNEAFEIPAYSAAITRSMPGGTLYKIIFLTEEELHNREKKDARLEEEGLLFDQEIVPLVTAMELAITCLHNE